MGCCDKKEVSVLDKIAEKVQKLDLHLKKLNGDNEGKIKHWVEQEMAIHDIHSIVRHALKLDKLEEKSTAAELTADEAKVVEAINEKFDRLKENLAQIDVGNDKLKAILEHENLVSEVKAILDKAGKLSAVAGELSK